MTSVRAAAHVHSSWSDDAEWSLPDIARAFRRRRYDVVLMSEHDRGFDQQRWARYQRACMAASTDGILLVPGIEYEDADNVVHTPVWGFDVPFLGAGRPTLELLRSAQAEGAVAVLAHPWRRNAISRYQPEWAPLLSAVEIWNRKYDGIAPHHAARKFIEKEGFAPFVALDFHTSRQFFPLAMAVSLDERPSPGSLVEAIRAGRCQPEFLGLSALRFTRGLEGLTLRCLEAARRGMRGPLRRLPERTAG
jgi:predicted metal-dependent phosphoesterase TrpH